MKRLEAIGGKSKPRRPPAGAGAKSVARATAQADAVEQQAATAHILRALARSTTDPQPVFEAIVQHAHRLTGALYSVLYRYDGESITVAADRHVSRAASRAQRASYPRAPSPDYLIGRTILEGRTVHTADLPNDPRFQGSRHAIQKYLSRRALVAVPLLRDGVVIGAIGTGRAEAKAFTKKEIKLLETFADQAVIAIEKVRLFNETKEALEQQTATSEILGVINRSPNDIGPVFDAVLAHAVRLTEGNTAVLWLYDGTYLRFAASRRADGVTGATPTKQYFKEHPLELGTYNPTPQAALERRTVHVVDVFSHPGYKPLVPPDQFRTQPNASTVLAVPLLGDTDVLGVITIWRFEKRAFTDRQIAMVNTFAAQAVLAIQNVRLFNETKEALEQQTATADILKVISASPTQTVPVFEAIVQSAARLFEPCNATIIMREGDELRRKARAGPRKQAGLDELNRAYPILVGSEMPSARAIRERRIVEVLDTRPLRSSAGQFANYRSATVVPLVRGEEAIGTLSITHAEPGYKLTSKQLQLLQTFAEQAVIAIENVRLFNETKEALERQTASAEVLRVISGTPSDAQPVFEAIAQAAVRVFNVSHVGINVVEDGVIKVKATAGRPDPRGVFTIPLDRNSTAGRSVLDRALIQVEDTEGAGAAPFTRESGRLVGFRAIATAPMLREGAAVGSVSMMRDTPGAFTDKQLELLQTFADQAAIAIDNARLFNELQTTNASLREALEQQTATGDILSVISSSPTNVQPVFDTIVRNAVRLCDGAFGALFTFDGQMLDIAADVQPSEEVRQMYQRGFPQPIEKPTPSAQAIRERRVVNVADIHETDYDEDVKERARASGFRSVLTLPMMRGDTPIGAIAVTRREAAFFSESYVALLKTFADQAVIAIENVRLFNETKEALEQQTAISEVLRVISDSPTDVKPVLDAVAVRAAKICDAFDARIWLVEGDSARLAAGFGDVPMPVGLGETLPLDRGWISGRAILERTAVHIEDSAKLSRDEYPITRKLQERTGLRTTLSVPLTRESRALGAILLCRKEVRPFTDKQVALLKTFADQAAIAIENVRLFNELRSTNASLREALEQQTATSDLLKVIGRSSFDLQPVFETLVENAVRLCGAERGFVFRFDGQFLRYTVGHNVSPELKEFFERNPITPGRNSNAGRAAIERRTVHNHDVLSDPEYSYGGVRVDPYRTVLAVPMFRAHDLLGVIVIYRHEVRPFADDQIALMETFADQAAIAIENVRLFNETKESLERQTATSEILRVISSSPTDVQPVFDAIARSAVALCNGVFGAVFRYDGRNAYFAAHYGFSDEALELMERRYPRVPEGLIAASLLESKVSHSSDTLSDSRTRNPELHRALGVRSFLSVPMLLEERPLGAISVFRREPGPFTDAQVAVLQTFADQAVIAIENVRLFNETKEALEQQTAISEVLRVISSSPADVQPVLEAVAVRAARICDATDVRIFLAKGEQLRHVAGFGDVPLTAETFALDRGSASGRSVVDRMPVHIHDILAEPHGAYPVSREIALRSGWRTALAVPLIRENRALGAILVRRLEVRPFSQKQIALLKTFADQAAIAIENVRLFNETKEALEQQKASADVLGVISSSIADTQPVFDKILDSCERLFEGHLVGITVLRPDGQLDRAAYRGPHEEEIRSMFPMPLSRDSASGNAVLDAQIVHYPDIEAPGVPAGAVHRFRLAGTRAIICAPMLFEGRGIGAIWVGRTFAAPFSEKHITLLRTFAGQAAIAIQNARLFREIQEKSAQLEVANKHKSDFLANMSHELRTPLNAIIGFSEALNDRLFGELNEKQAEYLKDIHDSGKHLLSLINDILDLSKIEAGRMDLELSSFSLPAALSNAMTLIRERAQRHGIELGLEVDPRLGEFQGDERKFKQIMLNLLSNAVKFTPDGGRVNVCAKKDTDKLEIAVRDTGIGIAPEDQSAVFEEFTQVGGDQRRKAEGTGLGLALCKRFVELHGGAIRLESVPGKGSTFTVTLPIQASS